MNTENRLPELKEIIGALLLASDRPLSTGRIRAVLQRVAESHGGAAAPFAELAEKDLLTALQEVRNALAAAHVGLCIGEAAGGCRLENDVCCGPWVRELVARGQTARLSKATLETLAVVAYRQPCTRMDIESVRGVSVDQIMRHLLELQLVRIVGRSDLPGRPMLYGTTRVFLEHFGIRGLDDLPDVEELRATAQKARDRTGPRPAAVEGEEPEVAAPLEPEDQGGP